MNPLFLPILVTAALAGVAAPAYADAATSASVDIDPVTTHIRFGGIVTGAPQEHPRGFAIIRTAAQWRRTTPDRSTHATFAPLSVSAGCTATVRADASTEASTRTARALLAERVTDGETVRRAGGRSPFRVGAHSAGAESPMRIFALRMWKLAPHRYAMVRVNMLFSGGCPAGVVTSTDLHDAVEQVVRSVRLEGVGVTRS